LTIKLDVQSLYEILRAQPADLDGFSSMKTFLAKSAEVNNCTVLTIRNFVYKHKAEFELKHGLIKLKLTQTLPEQETDLKEYDEWVLNRTKILDECIAFMQVQIPSPYLENLLVLAANSREEFKSYGDSNLMQLVFDLKREYDFTPQTDFKEGDT
jgi:hypothetical protein